MTVLGRLSLIKHKKRKTSLGLLMLSIMATNLTHAEESMWNETLQYHGFITQALIKTDENRYFGHSEIGSAALSEIGLNGSSRINHQLMVSAQILARRAGEMYDGSPEIDYALLDYSIHSDADKRYGLRLGRFKNPLGLYNETRDVAFTRPSIFMPQSIYFDNIRNSYLSNDGILGYSEFYNDDYTISFQFGIGSTPVDLNLEYALLGEDIAGSLEEKDLSMVSRLQFEKDNLKLALSYANANLEMQGTPAFIGNGVFDVNIWIASLEYITGDWTFTVEQTAIPITTSNFSPFVPDGNNSRTTGGHYIQASYRLDSKVELMTRYERAYADVDDKDGTERNSGLPPHNYFTHDAMAGIRWDVSNQFMLRAEFHVIDGTFILSRRENDPANTVKDWNMFAVLGSYHF